MRPHRLPHRFAHPWTACAGLPAAEARSGGWRRQDHFCGPADS